MVQSARPDTLTCFLELHIDMPLLTAYFLELHIDMPLVADCFVEPNIDMSLVTACFLALAPRRPWVII